MLTLLGWLFCGLFMVWASIVVFFLSVDTFSEGLLSGRWYQRIIGVLLWVLCLYGWYSWFGSIEVKV